MTLHKASAIIIAKMNVLQTLLTFKSMNLLWGCMCNPWSVLHTAGASSSGEGMLLAMDSAMIGVGMDISGSICIPLDYYGIYGFKPGLGCVLYAGLVGALF